MAKHSTIECTWCAHVHSVWYLGLGHALQGLVPLCLSPLLKLLRGLQLGSGFTLNIPKDKERGSKSSNQAT